MTWIIIVVEFVVLLVFGALAVFDAPDAKRQEELPGDFVSRHIAGHEARIDNLEARVELLETKAESYSAPPPSPFPTGERRATC